MEIPVGFAQCTLKFDGGALPTGAAVVFGVQNDTDKSALDIAEEVGDIWVARVHPGLDDSVTFRGVLAKKGPTLTGEAAEFPRGVLGGVDGSPIQPATCLLVKKLTALGGREGRGRMFVPGLGEAVVGGDGVIQPAAVTSWQTRFSNLGVDLELADLPMVVLHNSSTAPTVVTALAVDALVATQRRRLRR